MDENVHTFAKCLQRGKKKTPLCFTLWHSSPLPSRFCLTSGHIILQFSLFILSLRALWEHHFNISLITKTWNKPAVPNLFCQNKVFIWYHQHRLCMSVNCKQFSRRDFSCSCCFHCNNITFLFCRKKGSKRGRKSSLIQDFFFWHRLH